MNKQEILDELDKLVESNKDLGESFENGFDYAIKQVKLLVQKMNEPQKVTVPKVAIDYYEKYKNRLSGFDEWFGDFYDSGFLEEFPGGEKLAEWLYDNPNEVNKQRELALANLIVNGPSAVEIEQEKLYTVEIPNPHSTEWSTLYLAKDFNEKLVIHTWSNYTSIAYANNWKFEKNAQLTESEIKQDFEWAWRWAKPAEE